MLLKSIICVCLLTTQFVLASEVRVLGRTYTHSCGYYSQTSADFKITYKNSTLPWGTKVYLLSGLNGTQGGENKILWQNQVQFEIKAVSGFTWAAELNKTINTRSSSTTFNQMVFMFHIVGPSGESTYDTGSEKPWSFFEVNIPENPRCVSNVSDFPEYSPLQVNSIHP